MPLLKVHTAQNVRLDFTIGNIGQRILAAMIDLLIVICYFILMQYALATLTGIRLLGENVDTLYFLIIALPATFYLPVSEFLWKGQTVGKRWIKLRVVRTDGSSPSLGDIILRWLLRTIDVKLGFLFIFFVPKTPSSVFQETLIFWILFFLVVPFPVIGIISMALSPIGQRLGDIVADTAVIVHRRPFSLDDTILQVTETDYQPRFLNVLQLRDKDIYIIKNALEDGKKTMNYRHIKTLGDKAKEVLDIREDIKPLQLLETLVRDYNYLAKKRDLGSKFEV